MPKALLSENSMSTNFTTRALKWLGRLDSNQSMQESKSCALPAWLHPNIYSENIPPASLQIKSQELEILVITHDYRHLATLFLLHAACMRITLAKP